MLETAGRRRYLGSDLQHTPAGDPPQVKVLYLVTAYARHPTDVITPWPRPEGPYAGSVAVLEDVAASMRSHS